MELMSNERIKHFVLGLAVIFSIGAMILPLITKKNQQHLGRILNISVHLPSKPSKPQVAILDEHALFKSIKVAHVTIPVASEISNNAAMPEATLLSAPKEDSLKLASALPSLLNTEQGQSKQKTALNPDRVESKKFSPNQQSVFTVQVATFSRQANAALLVKQLHAKGYKATYTEVKNNKTTLYKVFVGKPAPRVQAELLKRQLANRMSLKGLLVSTKEG